MSRAATSLLILFSLCACADPSDPVDDGADMGVNDASPDTVTEDDPWADTPPDLPEDIPPDEEDTFPFVPQGQFELTLPSDVAGTEGLAVLVRHPASKDRRYPNGAPVVVIVPEGWGPGNFERNPIATRIASYGFVVVEALFPGAEGLARKSGGTYDFRGTNCLAALRDVLRYAGDVATDTDGMKLTDRLGFADTTNLGVYGKANGANAAIVTLAQHGDALPEVAWFLAWEAPIGDQYADGELNSNPFYEPGTCDLTTCPWPGLEATLRFDYTGQTGATDFGNGADNGAGLFFLDTDDNGVASETEFAFRTMIPGPGPDGVLLHPSQELRANIDAVRDDLFEDRPGPPWLATTAQTAAFWQLRDGALRIQEAHQAFPGLMVMHLGTLFDHSQTASDYPHARSHVNGWLQAGHGWVRMNPDAVYMAHVTEQDPDGYVDNPANLLIPNRGANAWVELEMVGGVRTDEFIAYAGLLELADRAEAANRATNLDGVLYADP